LTTLDNPEGTVTFLNARMRSALLAVALLVAVGAGGCSSSQSPTAAPAPVGNLEKADITVDDFPSVDSAGLYIAEMDGYFADEGLNVTINQAYASQDTVSAIEDGKADISSADYVTYLDNELLDHKQLRIIAEASTLQPNQLTMLVAPGSKIVKVKQLAGKTIAVAGHDDIATLLIDSLLTENDVPLKEVTVEPGYQLPAIPALLTQHKIDAGPVPEPFVSEGEEQFGVQQIADLDQGSTENFPIQGFAVTQAWARQNPNTLRAFVAALSAGQQVADTDRRAVEQAIEKFLHVPAMTAAVIALPDFPLSVDPQELQRVLSTMVQFGFVPERDSSFRLSSMIAG
jgi:NitT/TauT family transport system substrate-binding protein